MNPHFCRRLLFAFPLSLACLLSPFLQVRSQTPVEAAWVSAASGNWTDVFRWNTFGFLPYPNNDAFDTYNVLIGLDASPQINLDTDITIQNLNLASSFIGGDKTLTPLDGFIWRGGGFNGGNGNLVSPMRIEMSGGHKWLRGFHVFNETEAIWISGEVETGLGGVFHNQADATFTAVSDEIWSAELGQPAGAFNNHGVFIKTQSTGETHMEVDFTNAGEVILESGSLKWSGNTVNLNTIQGAVGTHLEFAGGYTSLAESSLISKESVSFTSQVNPVEIRGVIDVAKGTDFAAKETYIHPETSLKSFGNTVLVRQGRTQFNSEETIGVNELLLMEHGEIIGNDVISVQDRFVWGNGTTLSGDASLFNITLAEMPRLDPSDRPRIFGGRAFVNFGKVLWTGGDMLMSSDAAFVNQRGAEFIIQDSIIAGALTTGEKAYFLNEGMFQIESPATTVFMDLDLVSRGDLHFPAGKITFGGSVQIEGGTFVTEETTLTTPLLSLQNCDFTGATVLHGSLSISGQTSIASPGSGLQVRGTLECAPATELILSVREQQAKSQIPAIDVSGTATLDGSILIEFEAGWEPLPGRRIPLMHFSALTGKFRNIFPLRLNPSISLIPVYEDHMIWLMPFHDGSDLPVLNLYLLDEEVLLTWPRKLVNYRVQAKSRVVDTEWTTLKSTLVNYMKIPIEEAGMIYRLIHKDAL